MTKSVKVLWLSHLVPYPPKGGVQQRSYNLLLQLSRHHEVLFLAFNQRAHLANAALEDARKEMEKFCRVLKILPIPLDEARIGKPLVAVRSLFTSAPYTINWLADPHFAEAIRVAVTQHEPDVVHFDTISLAPYLDCIGDRPAALNHHNIESEMLVRRAQNERNPLKRFYYWQEGVRLRRWERMVGSKFAVHLTCSSLDAERLQVIAPCARTAVIPNGVDLDYFSPQVHPVRKTDGSMIFAGRLSWYPNTLAIRFLINEIWPRLRKLIPDASLTIVGKGAPNDLVKKVRDDPKIVFTGFVPDVRPYLESAAVYVCPIFDGGGTKLKILDALAMGCAIVAHPIACEGIDVEDGVNVLFAQSPSEFADRIARAMGDPLLCQKLGEAARSLAVTKYSFNEIGKDLAQCYELLAKK